MQLRLDVVYLDIDLLFVYVGRTDGRVESGANSEIATSTR